MGRRQGGWRTGRTCEAAEGPGARRERRRDPGWWLRRGLDTRTPAVCAVAVLFSFSCSECRKGGATPRPTGRSWKTSPPEATDGGIVAQKLPRALHRGGAFLRNPRIVTVTFKNDDPAAVAKLEQFGDTITGTPWWRAVVDSYCVKDDCIGHGSSGGHLRLDEDLAGTVRDIQIEARIDKAIADRGIDVSDPDSFIIVHLPPNVALTDAVGTAYCSGPRAYQRALSIGERRLPYAVVPRCTDVDEATAAASHELLEGTTNPDPSQRGFAFEAGSSFLAFTISGLEPVDPCGVITRDGHRAYESGFRVQRAWSNREAALGHDPCVPSRPDKPYLALVPSLPIVRLTNEGDSATVTMQAVADRPVAGWSISAVDVTGDQEHTSYVELSVDRSRVERGETARVTIKLRKKSPKELALVGLVSTLDDQTHMWPLAVSIR